jgi:hypothetical protein
VYRDEPDELTQDGTGMDVSFFDPRDFAAFKQGVKRVKGEVNIRTALPLTLPLLSAVNAKLLSGYPSRRQVMLATAFSLALSCFLRSGEFTYDKFDPDLDLQRRDVIMNKDFAVLRIKSSKMDQTRKGKLENRSPGISTCLSDSVVETSDGWVPGFYGCSFVLIYRNS